MTVSMTRTRTVGLILVGVAAVLSACGGSGDVNLLNDSNTLRSVGSLRLIGQQVLPRRLN